MDGEDRSDGKIESGRPEQEVYVISDLEQVKVLADPLRLRILESLCLEERTTKQVAERIGEKPTRLYHHVDALERVGLIRLARTRQNRGTIEKYYTAVARRYEAASGLFASARTGSEDTETLESITATIFENTAREMRELIASGHGDGVEEEGILSYAEIRIGEDALDRLRARFKEVLKEFEGECCGKPSKEDDRRFRLTLAFFPLDRT